MTSYNGQKLNQMDHKLNLEIYIYVCIYIYIHTHEYTHTRTHTHWVSQGSLDTINTDIEANKNLFCFVFFEKQMRIFSQSLL